MNGRVLACIAWVLGLAACGGKGAAPVPAVGTASVPRTSGPIVIDGKCGEPSWPVSFRSPTFIDARGRRAPTAQVRATADDQNLYLEIYVADIDVESKGDVVRLEVGPLRIVLTPKHADVPSGVKVAMDVDGTIDVPNDNDEEWVTELQIPWSRLGSRRVPLRALRVDASRGEPLHALAWPRAAPIMLVFDR